MGSSAAAAAAAEAEWRAGRRRRGAQVSPPPAPPRAPRAPAAAAQSTATRRPGDSCSAHSVTFSTLSRALCVVSRFFRFSFPHFCGAPHLKPPRVSTVGSTRQVSTLKVLSSRVRKFARDPLRVSEAADAVVRGS
ncbi:hypothetical protein JYU34_016534 [Plutella xylostella]|uniref:Uncharacterized protein n=1 Tax=Plutella xylostella TaxID=51655 RepID=A0ABQ7Q2U8_PLUXY|nr:hypothetical protein JYU34_016534 [Plutella xylostella]